jgi:hypothetical protein
MCLEAVQHSSSLFSTGFCLQWLHPLVSSPATAARRPFFPSDGADALSGERAPQIKARQLLNIRTEFLLAVLTILSVHVVTHF